MGHQVLLVLLLMGAVTFADSFLLSFSPPRQMAWSAPSLHCYCSQVDIVTSDTRKRLTRRAPAYTKLLWRVPLIALWSKLSITVTSWQQSRWLQPLVQACQPVEEDTATCSGKRAEPINSDVQRWHRFKSVGRVGPHSPFLETGHWGLLIHPVPCPLAWLVTKS